ncbi:nucleotide disphospho-sugar-binding domain-containing protein [Actinokineospora sp. NPDC004072]
MRVMFTGMPHVSHLYPMVPLAQALQVEGHEVCFACPPGGGVDEIAAAGLTPVSFGTPADMSLADWADAWEPTLAEMEQLADQLRIATPDDQDHWDVTYQFFLRALRLYATKQPKKEIQSVVDFARAWRPDLVVWESWFPAGAVIAAASGAAHARMLVGPDYGGWVRDLYDARRAAGVDLGEDPVTESVRWLAEQHDVAVDHSLVHGQLTLDPLVPEMRLSRDLGSIPMRWSPYNGGSLKPEWLYERPARPRIALSWGVSTRGYLKGEWRTPKVLEAVAPLDVEVVATMNSDQLQGITLPANVRAVDYVPLTQLLPTCSAIVSHGSSGTFWSAVAAGVPQLIGDTDDRHLVLVSGEGEHAQIKHTERAVDSRMSARYVADRGAGFRLNHETQSVEEIREQLQRVLTDPAFQAGADTLRQEWLAKPSPAQVVPNLVELADNR